MAIESPSCTICPPYSYRVVSFFGISCTHAQERAMAEYDAAVRALRSEHEAALSRARLERNTVQVRTRQRGLSSCHSFSTHFFCRFFLQIFSPDFSKSRLCPPFSRFSAFHSFFLPFHATPRSPPFESEHACRPPMTRSRTGCRSSARPCAPRRSPNANAGSVCGRLGRRLYSLFLLPCHCNHMCQIRYSFDSLPIGARVIQNPHF